MPRKLYFSEEEDREVINCDVLCVNTVSACLWRVDLTHVECHREDVEAHG